MLNFRRLAIWVALLKPAAEWIPESGPELRVRNFCAVYLLNEDGKRAFYVKALTPSGYGGSRFVDGSPQDGEISEAESAKLKILIKRFFGHLDLHYDSEIEFVLHTIFRVPALKNYWFRRRIRAANARSRVLATRIAVLDASVDMSIFHSGKELTPTAFDVERMIAACEGDMWGYRRDQMELYRYYQAVILSWVVSGHLERSGGGYSATPLALQALHDHRAEEMRFERQTKLSLALTWLTAALVVVGCLPLALQLFGRG